MKKGKQASKKLLIDEYEKMQYEDKESAQNWMNKMRNDQCQDFSQKEEHISCHYCGNYFVMRLIDSHQKICYLTMEERSNKHNIKESQYYFENPKKKPIFKNQHKIISKHEQPKKTIYLDRSEENKNVVGREHIKSEKQEKEMQRNELNSRKKIVSNSKMKFPIKKEDKSVKDKPVHQFKKQQVYNLNSNRSKLFNQEIIKSNQSNPLKLNQLKKKNILINKKHPKQDSRQNLDMQTHTKMQKSVQKPPILRDTLKPQRQRPVEVEKDSVHRQGVGRSHKLKSEKEDYFLEDEDRKSSMKFQDQREEERQFAPQNPRLQHQRHPQRNQRNIGQSQRMANESENRNHRGHVHQNRNQHVPSQANQNQNHQRRRNQPNNRNPPRRNQPRNQPEGTNPRFVINFVSQTINEQMELMNNHFSMMSNIFENFSNFVNVNIGSQNHNQYHHQNIDNSDYYSDSSDDEDSSFYDEEEYFQEEDSEPEGLNSEEIQMIRLRKFKKSADGNHQCTICLGELQNNEMYKRLNCDHIFHGECIDEWLRRKSACPVCRDKIRMQ